MYARTDKGTSSLAVQETYVRDTAIVQVALYVDNLTVLLIGWEFFHYWRLSVVLHYSWHVPH